MDHETFWGLLRSPAHIELELFLMFVFDFLIGAILWPKLKKFRNHHQSDDDRVAVLEKKVNKLEKIINAYNASGLH
jgi:hypothetical protein